MNELCDHCVLSVAVAPEKERKIEGASNKYKTGNTRGNSWGKIQIQRLYQLLLLRNTHIVGEIIIKSDRRMRLGTLKAS